MSVEIVKVASRGHQIGLTVEQDGLRVVVRSGPFTFKGEELSLGDDIEYTATPDDEFDVVVTGYLARPSEGGDVTVVVDEVVQNGMDRPSRWSGYEAIHCLFSTTVQPGATSLDVRVEHLEKIVRR